MSALIFLAGMILIVGIAIFVAMNVLKSHDIEVLMKNKKYQAVIDAAGRLLEDEPNNLRYHELVIESLIKMEHIPEANQQFQYVLQNIPDSNNLCPVIAKFLGEQGQYQLASEWLKESCTEDAPVSSIPIPEDDSEPVFFETEPALQ